MIINKEEFWHEIRILAKDYYGDCNGNPEIAEKHVNDAISDCLASLDEQLHKDLEIGIIVKELLQD